MRITEQNEIIRCDACNTILKEPTYYNGFSPAVNWSTIHGYDICDACMLKATKRLDFTILKEIIEDVIKQQKHLFELESKGIKLC